VVACAAALTLSLGASVVAPSAAAPLLLLLVLLVGLAAPLDAAAPLGCALRVAACTRLGTLAKDVLYDGAAVVPLLELLLLWPLAVDGANIGPASGFG
jgi:hypothetical protein